MKIIRFLQQLLFGSGNRILIFLLSILGCSGGCRPDRLAMEYGVPSADYKISGKVTAIKDNKSLNDILIKLQNIYRQTIDSVYTDTSGYYNIEWKQMPDIQWLLIAQDVDGTANGEFIEKDSLIIIPANSLKGGDGHWYEGKAELKIDIKLKEK